MKAYEFPTQLTEDKKIELPAILTGRIPNNQVLRVIVLVREQDIDPEEEEWRKAAEAQFLASYAPEDSIYDRMT